MTRTDQTLPDRARQIRDTGTAVVRDRTRNAVTTVRVHRQEIQILAATAVFVALVLLVSLPTVL